MKTITGSDTSVYNLNASNSAVTFAATADLNVPSGVALYGSTAASWMVTNLGTIVGEISWLGGGQFDNGAGATVTGEVNLGASDASGAEFQNSGTLTGFLMLANGGSAYNYSTGTIAGAAASARYGIELGGAGKITNAGAISGVGFGVVASLGAADTIINQSGGAITGASTGIGVLFGFPALSAAGGALSNLAGGEISGGAGVIASDASASVGNAGVIIGTNASVYTATFNSHSYSLNLGDGVYLASGGSLANYAGGRITGARYGVYIKGSSGSITNSGAIYGASGVKFEVSGGTVTNKGVIRATGASSNGVFLGEDATLINSGRTIARGNTAVYLSSGAGLTNEQGALILGGIGVSSQSGYVIVTNNGAIAAAGTSPLTGAVDLYSGDFVNSATGVITEAGYGVAGVDMKSLGVVTNGGKISVTGVDIYGVTLFDGGTITNANSISVDGSYSSGVYLKNGGVLNNNGTISATGDTVFSGVYLAAGGTINNESAGVISGDNPIYALGAANVVNYGMLNGLSGVYMEAGGTVYNHAGGSIVSTATGETSVYLAESGTVTNYGSISGLGHGVLLSNGGEIINGLGGVITGTSVGAGLNLGGKIHNPGTITATYVGVLVGDIADSSDGGGLVANFPTGVIKADAGVVATGQPATVVNAGTIKGTSEVPLSLDGKTFMLGDGVSMFGGGSFTNRVTGVVTGARYGVYMAGGAGSITNPGEISGGAAAIEFAGDGANQLTLQTGSVLLGAVIGSEASGATNALILQGTDSLGNAVRGFNTLAVDAGASWSLTSNDSFGATTIDGRLMVYDGLTSSVLIENGGVLGLLSTLTGNLSFSGAGELALRAPYLGAISGFGVSDSFFLAPFTLSQTRFSFSENAGNTAATLSFAQSGAATETLTLDGAYTKSEFSLAVGPSGYGVMATFA